LAWRSELGLPDTMKWAALSDTITEKELEQNPGYKAAKRSYQSKKAAAWSAWLSKLPYLSGSYSYGYSDSLQFKNNSDWINHDYWSATIALNWNLFDGGISMARVRQARAMARSAESDLFTARDVVRHLLQVLLVLLGQDDLGDAGPPGRNHLLLDAACPGKIPRCGRLT